MMLRAAALCLPLLLLGAIGNVRADEETDLAIRCSKYYMDQRDLVAECGADWTTSTNGCPDACKKFWQGVGEQCLLDQESRDQFNEWFSATCENGGFPVTGSSGDAPPAENTGGSGSANAASAATAGATVALLAMAAAALLA